MRLLSIAQRISREPTLLDISNAVAIAKLRFIQSLHDANPDTYVAELLSPPLRWLSRLQYHIQREKLREHPFYNYLLARTFYYDKIFMDAVYRGAGIINIGSGTDTRAYRFAQQCQLERINVLECDQAQLIITKRRLAMRKWPTGHVTYTAIDLNEAVTWANLEDWLLHRQEPVQVIMEGVSPYIRQRQFDFFLSFLARRLSPGSQVAYDFKIRSVYDKGFSLPATRDDIAIHHMVLGFKLSETDMILSKDISQFTEDVLVKVRCW
jgi:methyltransferase (TIGR00027 family)